MGANQNHIGVGMIKEHCPACGKVFESGIAISKKIFKSEKGKEKFEKELQNPIGISNELCPECKEHAKNGIIFIGIDEEKTKDMKNPWRTGLFAVVEENAVKKFMKEPMLSQLLKVRMCYIEQQVAENLGLCG